MSSTAHLKLPPFEGHAMVVEVLHGAFAIPHHEAHPLPKAHALSNCHCPCGLVKSYQAPHQEVLHATQARLELLTTGQMTQKGYEVPMAHAHPNRHRPHGLADAYQTPHREILRNPQT